MAQKLTQAWSWALALSAGLLSTHALASPHAWAAPPVSQGPSGAGFRTIGMPMGMRAADQHFIAMMIPHHDGAIAMAELALVRAKRPQIRTLAQQIKASQTAENAQMRRWYRQWYGTEVPDWTSFGFASGMGMSGMGMGMGMPGMGLLGMATSLEMLKAAPDFDRAFLEQMIPHHRMGVMMASHAQWNTIHPELRDLEAAMVRVQRQEIEQMEQWYRQWYGSAARLR